jgi:hypothetical protein
MKSNRTWPSVLAFLLLPFLASAAAHALPDCQFVCDCGVPCSQRCTPGLSLLNRTCGEGYACSESPGCTDLVASSLAMTSNTSSAKADLLLESIFTPTTSMSR